MKKNWLIIPDFERREESAKLAQAYDAGFEYNDFFNPSVYLRIGDTEISIMDISDINGDIYQNLEEPC